MLSRFVFQYNFLTLAGRSHNRLSAILRHRLLRALDHGRNFFVVVIGIVMEEKQSLYTGANRELHGIVSAGMTPAAARRIFDRILLGISDQHVRIAEKIDHLLILNSCVFQSLGRGIVLGFLAFDFTALVRLMIGHVDNVTIRR